MNEHKISKITIFGDSVLAIHQFTKTKKAMSCESSTLSQRILASISQFEQVDFFHVYKHLNSVADEPAKKRCHYDPQCNQNES